MVRDYLPDRNQSLHHTENGAAPAKWEVLAQRARATRTGLMEDWIETVAACLNEMMRGSPDVRG